MGWGSFAGSIVDAGAGSIVDAGVGIWATNKNNKAAKHAAEMQRGWEEYMSNTAHQREVDDLRAAGLNPILSATGGSGASTPAGATAQVHPYDTSRLAFVSAAKQLEKTEEEIEGIEKGIETQDTVQEVNRSQAIKNIADSREAEARSATAQAQEEQIRAQTRLIEAETPRTDAMSRLYKTPFIGPLVAGGREILGVANSALDVGRKIHDMRETQPQTYTGKTIYYDKNGNAVGGYTREGRRTIESYSKKRRKSVFK